MKTKTLLLTILLTCFLLFHAHAQLLNPGFENWTNSGYGYEDPDNWLTFNNYYLQTATKSTNAYSGNYALQLATKSYTLFGVVDTVVGAAEGGFPFTQRPAMISAYCKYTPTGSGDMAVIAASLSKWNSSTNHHDDIAAAVGTIVANSGYTQINMAFIYQLTDIPDSLTIAVSSSSDGVPATLLVDAFTTSGVSGINGDEVQMNKTGVFPNPVKDILNVYSSESGNSIEIYDLLGNMISTYQCFGILSRFNIENYSEGIYLYNIKDHSGVSINKGKFTVTE